MLALLTRDLTLAFRSGGGFGLSLAFLLIVVTLVPFGVGPDPAILSRIAPGMIWVAALLSCLLSLDRIFALDAEDGSLDLLATAPIPLEGVVAAKALAHWLTTSLPIVVFAPLFALILNLPSGGYLWLALSLLVGTPALSLIGAFGAALTLAVRRGGLLLSLLVLPLYVPTLIFGADVARRAAEGQGPGTAFLLLAGVSAGCAALLPFAGAAVLRAGLR
jgi:heme exporter protein B